MLISMVGHMQQQVQQGRLQVARGSDHRPAVGAKNVRCMLAATKRTPRSCDEAVRLTLLLTQQQLLPLLQQHLVWRLWQGRTSSEAATPAVAATFASLTTAATAANDPSATPYTPWPQ
jgi:hypothetical protein